MRNPNRDYISTTEAAKLLRVSRITVWNKIEQRKLWATKIGHSYVIRKSDLAKVAESLIVRRTNKRPADEVLKDLKRVR